MEHRKEWARLRVMDSIWVARKGVLRLDARECYAVAASSQHTRRHAMTPSHAFVGEPETNCVIKRFFRTLKEQIVHGRIIRLSMKSMTPSATSSSVINAEWLIENNGLRSPSDATASLAPGRDEVGGGHLPSSSRSRQRKPAA
jgi:hypothetical protein